MTEPTRPTKFTEDQRDELATVLRDYLVVEMPVEDAIDAIEAMITRSGFRLITHNATQRQIDAEEAPSD